MLSLPDITWPMSSLSSTLFCFVFCLYSHWVTRVLLPSGHAPHGNGLTWDAFPARKDLTPVWQTLPPYPSVTNPLWSFDLVDSKDSCTGVLMQLEKWGRVDLQYLKDLLWHCSWYDSLHFSVRRQCVMNTWFSPGFTHKLVLLDYDGCDVFQRHVLNDISMDWSTCKITYIFLKQTISVWEKKIIWLSTSTSQCHLHCHSPKLSFDFNCS